MTSHYNIQLNFIDSNLHFIEKTVPLFEQTKMASIKDLKDNTEIQDFLEEDIEKKENFIDYLHKKMSCHLKIDLKKIQYYDNIRNAVIKDHSLVSSHEFIFNETLPNGKLSIPDTNDDKEEEDDDEKDTCLKNVVPEETALLLSKFCKEYDISLSSIEKKAIFKDLRNRTKKKQLFRNAHGKFVKRNDIENPNKDSCTEEESESISKDTFDIKNILPYSFNISDILNVNTNASIFDDLVKNESGYDVNQLENNCKEPVIDDTVLALDKTFNDNILRLFRPFKDYWMYHCNFSRVKPKNFELFEKTLPRSFRWLLNECARVIEMSVEDLYEEVCLVEAYYAYFSEQSSNASNETTENSNNKAYINAIFKKW